MGYIQICLKCGLIQHRNNINDGCRMCNGILKECNYESDYYFSMEYQQKQELRKILRDRYVLNPNNSEYDEDEYYKREDEEIQQYMRAHNYRPIAKPDPNACPKCGNTQFTPVRQKWSIFTGFRTNKVDLVCNKCGYRKKG